jgi:two-component system chemotaxis response regulator CheY
LTKLTAGVGLIITDWNMPEMSGPDFTRAIRSHPHGRSVPILMVTTRGAREEIVAAVDAGVTSYIHKPFTPPVLKEKIERVLAGVGAAADMTSPARRDDLLYGRRGASLVDLRFRNWA